MYCALYIIIYIYYRYIYYTKRSTKYEVAVALPVYSVCASRDHA